MRDVPGRYRKWIDPRPRLPDGAGSGAIPTLPTLNANIINNGALKGDTS